MHKKGCHRSTHQRKRREMKLVLLLLLAARGGLKAKCGEVGRGGGRAGSGGHGQRREGRHSREGRGKEGSRGAGRLNMGMQGAKLPREWDLRVLERPLLCRKDKNSGGHTLSSKLSALCQCTNHQNMNEVVPFLPVDYMSAGADLSYSSVLVILFIPKT